MTVASASGPGGAQSNRLLEADIYRDAIANMSDGVLLFDDAGRIVTWNERLLDLLPHMRGLLRPGITSRALSVAAVQAAHPEWSPSRKQAWIEEREESLRKPDYKSELILHDGRIVSVTHRRSNSGGFVAVYHDVTAERRAIQSLAMSEARFRDAVDGMGEGLTLWDGVGRLLLWNRRYVELLPHVESHLRVGATAEEINRAAVRHLFPGCSQAELDAKVAARHAARLLPGEPFLMTLPDGRTIEMIDRPTSEGGLVTVYRDVTESRRAADALAASEARFRDGIQSMAEGFVMWDAEDRLVIWNERFLEMLPYMRPFIRVGVGRAEVVAGAVDAAFPHLTPVEREAWVAERVASFRQYDRVFIMRPVGDRTFEVVERRTSDGGSVVLYRDVSDRERQAADLRRALTAEREANQQQRRFIAIASHEFRTPLTVIDGSAQLLLQMLRDAAPEVHKRLGRIRASVLKMTQLIDRTLSSARLDDGRLEYRPEQVDLVALMRDVVARQVSISPEFSFDVDAPAALLVVGDPRLLELVLTNLVSNAVKYSGASRRIEVALAADRRRARLSIRDHGVGVPLEERPRLFQRYFRASTAAGIPGTGIGLHLVRELVSMHGGTIEVDSDLGRGSEFAVVLPVRGREAARVS